MRNANNTSGGVGGFIILIPIVFVCGVLAMIAASRAELFKPQPSQAVVSVAYATRAKIENDAMRDRLAADLTHAQNMQRIERDFAQTAKDLLIVAGGVGVLFALAAAGTQSRRMWGQSRLNARVINPNRRGVFGVYVDHNTGRIFNPNMQTTPALDMANPQSLSEELQIEALAWYSRARIAESMSQTKTFPMTANQERGLLRQTAWPALPTGKPPIVIGGDTATAEPAAEPVIDPDDTTGIHMHDDPALSKPTQPARAVVNTSAGDVPDDITSEDEFNEYMRGRK